jgi:putative N6-adenine-specific DNA methylase
MELIATCAFGLEKLVYDELKRLGIWVIKKEDGRVFFKGEAREIVLTNLWLRCADRVQIMMGEFEAKTFDELFDRANALEWDKYIGAADAFPVDATSVKSLLHSAPAIQSIVKKAVVKKLQVTHRMELFPENSGTVYSISVKTNKDKFTVAIDTSGESLHKRGYRTRANLAPIKETLAAAMIKLSDWTPDRTLIDPFCGSGTIAIEAAMIAFVIAPGLKRDFAFKKWPWMDKKIIEDTYAQAQAAAKTGEAGATAKQAQKLPIYSFDIDPEALVIAQENAARAGFPDLNFKRSDFNDLDFTKFENCTFITNPPYGERMDEKPQVQIMYRKLGKRFSESRDCSLFLITSDENFPKLFGRPADKNRKLFNGRIRCYLFSFLAKTAADHALMQNKPGKFIC